MKSIHIRINNAFIFVSIMILFADPKQSKIDIVQALGRALRYYKGKKIGYVLLPIIIEDDECEKAC